MTNPEPSGRALPDRGTLVVRLADAVGDVVMMRPALQLLIDRGYPIVATGAPFCASLLRGLDLEFQPLPQNSETFRELRQSTGEYALTLRSSFRSSHELLSAGFRVVGFRGDLRSLLLWRSMGRPKGHHKMVEYHRLAEYAAAVIEGGRPPDIWVDPSSPHIEVPGADINTARRTLKDAGVDAGYVVCCPTVAAHHPHGFKIWPSFPRFYEELERAGVQTVTCPAPGEEERCLEVSPRGVVLEGIGLEELAAVLAGSTAVVSNDTGTMHLAAAVGTRTIGLFGDTDPGRYAPRSKRSITLGKLGDWPTLGTVLREIQGSGALDLERSFLGGLSLLN